MAPTVGARTAGSANCAPRDAVRRIVAWGSPPRRSGTGSIAVRASAAASIAGSDRAGRGRGASTERTGRYGTITVLSGAV